MFKLAISNIAWDHSSSDSVLEELVNEGVVGIEVAPTKIAPWEVLDSKLVKQYRKNCENFGLVIPAFQAILFGKPELQLLGNEIEFIALKQHIEYVASLAAEAGAKVLVFGAPKNRSMTGTDLLSTMNMALERFHILAEVVWQYNIVIGLEAIPPVYNCNFINSYKESLEIVKKINHPGLRFHLDGACTILNEDSIVQAVLDSDTFISHLHVTQPNLENFSDPHSYHNDFSKTLKDIGYIGWHSIEMKQQSLQNLKKSVHFVQKLYHSLHSAPLK